MSAIPSACGNRKRKLCSLCCVTLLFITTVLSLQAQAPRYTITDLGAFSGNSSEGDGINGAGQVVGFSAFDPDFLYSHAFLFSGGVLNDLHNNVTFGGPTSFARGINKAGDIVGQSDTPDLIPFTGNYIYRGFIYSGGTLTKLGTFGGQLSAAYAINDAGQVVGNATTMGDGAYHAFLYSGGMLTDLGTLGGINSFAYAINASGQVAGESSPAMFSAPLYHAFKYSGSVMSDLGTLGGTTSRASAINDAGDVIGYAQNATNANHAFIYQSGTMNDLGTLGGDNSFGYGLNNTGDIVGFAETTGNLSYVAFLYYNGTMYDLTTLVPTFSGSGFTSLDNARVINDSDQISGNGYTSSGFSHAFLATPILRITAVTKSGGVCTLQGQGLPLRSHSIKATLSLSQTFQPFGTTSALATGSFSFNDSDAGNHTRRFYRVTYP